MLRLAAAAAIAIGLASPVLAQEDFLDVPGPIRFGGTDFVLAWTSHPSPGYYKQEYVPAGQVVESYSEMFMVDVLTAGQTPRSAADSMIAGLAERKDSDPVLNYDMIENDATDEVILDFLISDASSGELIVEWNAYRYSPTEDGEGLTLFAISRRGYGEDGATTFLSSLTDWRQTAIEELATMDLPPITIAQ